MANAVRDHDTATMEVDDAAVFTESHARQALFSSVEGGDVVAEIFSVRPLIKLFDTRERQATTLSSISSHKFHKGHARRFFASLQPILKNVLDSEAHVPASAYESDDNDNNAQKPERSTVDPKDVVPDTKSTEALEFLKASAMCITAYLEGLIDRRAESESTHKIYYVVEEVVPVAESLHGVLFSLHDCGIKGMQVQASIASMCELWWQQRFIHRESMVVQLVPYLVVKSLQDSAQKSDVKRLFMIRDALTVLDFEQASIHYLKSLLLRTVSSPLFLKLNEGKRFIAGLVSLHISLMKELHQAIRVQIPEGKKLILESYGEIYYRAWKEAAPEERSVLEEACLADLVFAVLYVSTTNMVKAIQTVLEPFHLGKKNPEVEDMLYRMYGPILWRSIQAANPKVRRNGAHVLAQVFPLQKGSSLDAKDTERALHKGIKALKALLTDSDPHVRVAASEAAVNILATFWDVLPPTDIRMILNHIVAEHASDASSSAVRAAAVKSITLLLDAEESHAVLRALLPSLGNLIHDKVERVRLATVRMLLRVKHISGIKYYHVVPVDHLLARLGSEIIDGPVASALTELMLNSYCPQGPNVSGSDQVKRTIAFLRTDPLAAEVFYSNVAAHLSVGSVAKLAAMLLRCLCAFVDTDKAKMAEIEVTKGKKRRRYGKKEDGDDADGDAGATGEEMVLTAANTALMASLARTICFLWESIEVELEDNEACNEFLLESFSGAVLTDIHAHFEQKAVESEDHGKRGSIVRDDCFRTCAAILRCAGRLPPKAVQGLARHISSKLADLKANIDDDTVRENVTPYIAFLCLWGMTDDVANSLAQSIQFAYGDNHDLTSPVGIASNKRKGRRDQNVEPAVPPLPARIALEVLGDLLRGFDPSAVAAREAILSSSAACMALESALEMGTVRAERILQASPVFPLDMPETEIELILKSCELYGRFALHKEALKDGQPNFGLQAKTLLKWTDNRVVPVLMKGITDGISSTPFADLNISRISAATDSPVQPESPPPMPPSRQRQNRNSTPLRLGDSFGSGGDKAPVAVASDNESTALLAYSAAVSLLQSSCVIFSEWLAVGGSGSDIIATSASNWCRIFSIIDDKVARQAELQPAFTRLAVELCKTGSDFSVLQQLIANCDETNVEGEEDCVDMKKTVSALLSGRDAQAKPLLGGTVAAVLGAARCILSTSRAGDDASPEMPLTLSEIWDIDKGSVFSSLAAVLSNKKAVAVLAEKLVTRFENGYEVDTVQDPVALFEAKLLWFLSDVASCGGSVDVKIALGRLDVEKFAGDGAVKDVLRNVADRLAV